MYAWHVLWDLNVEHSLSIDHLAHLTQESNWVVQVFEHMADHHQIWTGTNRLEVLVQFNAFEQWLIRDINNYPTTASGGWEELPFIAAKINGNSELPLSRLSKQLLHEKDP